MTAIPTVGALTEIAVTDIPISLRSGTAPKRRAIVILRCTSAATTNTLNLATYVPEIADIEGIAWKTVADAVMATSPTWSTTTVTFAGHSGSGVSEIGFVCNFT